MYPDQNHDDRSLFQVQVTLPPLLSFSSYSIDSFLLRPWRSRFRARPLRRCGAKPPRRPTKSAINVWQLDGGSAASIPFIHAVIFSSIHNSAERKGGVGRLLHTFIYYAHLAGREPLLRTSLAQRNCCSGFRNSRRKAAITTATNTNESRCHNEAFCARWLEDIDILTNN